MVDDVEQNHNEFTHVVVGNYYRTLSQFDKAIESYNKLENFQDQGVRNLLQIIIEHLQIHLRVIFLLLRIFRKNVELGNQFGAYTWLPQMFLFDNNFDAAISVLDEFEENLISLNLPAQQELNSIVTINRLKFLCYAHNQLEDESLQHIQLTKEAQMNAINLERIDPENEYNEQVKYTNYSEETF